MHEAISKDGARIRYCLSGSGPVVIVVHVAFQCADSHTDLAQALSSTFAVVLYSRRGRDDNPAFGDDHSIQTEVNDLDTILMATDAAYIFGISSGALICLEASRQLYAIRKAVLYEPVLSIDDSLDMSFVE